MPRLSPPTQQQLQPFAESLALVEQQMGFAPNSMPLMAHRPAMLGSAMLFMSTIFGFRGRKIAKVAALKQFLRTLKWTRKAQQESDSEIDPGLKQMIAFVTSNASGCRYCQAHTAHQAHSNGVPLEKIQALWSFADSDQFSDAEKAALSLAFNAGLTPNGAEDSHFDELKKHFNDQQITEIVAIIAMFGFLNRWNDTLQTPLETAPLNFAEQNLSVGGWNAEGHS
ncbi:MAG: carboxymuconolactone decarboxylase family protein [Pseudomonadota bacterium]